MPGLTQEAKAPTERGLNNQRIEFVRENEKGVVPTDPDWQLFSDVVTEAWAWQPEGNVEPQTGIGHQVPQGFFGGAEEHELEFTYQMQNWFVDENGEALDAAYDFFFRDVDGTYSSTHTIVGREDHAGGGAAGAGFRTYTVATGGHPTEPESEADASEAMPLPMTLGYQFARVRELVISQPSGETSLTVKSTDPADTTQSVTIEDEGAATAETVTLNGDTAVAVAGPFADIDALWLDAETVGDVVVSVNDGAADAPAEGTTLAEIQGKRSNSPPGSVRLQGNRGVPALGAGSHQTEIAPQGEREFIHFRGTELTRKTDAGMGARMNGITLGGENGTDTNERIASRSMAIDAGVLIPSCEVAQAGPTAGTNAAGEHLQTVPGDIEWTFDQGTIRFPRAVCTEAGEKAYESGQIVLYMDVTYQSEGIELLDTDGNVVASTVP
jgi:hypothetical protein